jgi:hypothetical protein
VGVRFKIFEKAIFQPRKVLARVDAAGLASMRRIGAVLMRASQKKIKRRIVTDSMRGRLAAAQAAGDKRRSRQILATIAKRQSAVSQPGQPPIAHVPDRPYRSIRDIRFHADARSVIVGPAGWISGQLQRSNRKTVPELLEFGGTSAVPEIDLGNGQWVRRTSKRPTKRRTRQRSARYAARPVMHPTLRENTDRARAIIGATMRKALP